MSFTCNEHDPLGIRQLDYCDNSTRNHETIRPLWQMEFLWQLDMDNTLSVLRSGSSFSLEKRLITWLILATSMAQILGKIMSPVIHVLAKLVFMTKFNVNAKKLNPRDDSTLVTYMYGSLTEQTLRLPRVHILCNRISNMEFNIKKKSYLMNHKI